LPSRDYQQARQALGARFRQLRKDAGLTGRQLADQLRWSQPKVSRIESGQRTPGEEDLLAFAEAIGATPEIADELLARVRLVHAAHKPGRRELDGAATVGQHGMFEMGSSVRLVRAFEPAVIPDMLETEDYALKLFADVAARDGFPNDVEEAVGVGLRRQQLLYDPAKRFEFLIAESALRSHFCAPSVMRAQLDLVRALSNLETVELYLIPAEARLPLIPLHGFWILDDDLVFVDTLHARVEATDPSEVAVYLRVFDQLKAAAHGGETARELLTRAMDDWRRWEDE
jgi:hypothetical protein